jgi:hypothetical protein
MLSKLTDKRNTVVQQTQQLRQELESMRQGAQKTQSRFSILSGLIVGFLGI